MAFRAWFIEQGRQQWRVADIQANHISFHDIAVEASAEPTQVATAIAEELNGLGYSGEPVTLGAYSQSCLAVNVPQQSLGQISSREALCFSLEEWLPLAAEEMVADYRSSSKEVFAVAIAKDGTSPLIDSLEHLGVSVQSISPTVLLAIQDLQATTGDESKAVLWQHEESVEFLWFDGTVPRIWQHWNAMPELILRELQLIILQVDQLPPLLLVNVDTSIEQCLACAPHHVFSKLCHDELAVSAARYSATVVSGKGEPWIELRRDSLIALDPYRPVRGTIRLALAVCAIFLIATCCALWFHARRYAHQTDEIVSHQTKIYLELFPGQPVSAGIRSRLESERAKLAGLQGQSAELPQGTSALVALYELLKGLPSDVRYRILELRIERGQVSIEGEAQSHSDSDRIATSLRQRGFRVDAPRTQRLAGGGVSMRITAEFSLPESKTPKPTRS